MAGSESHPMDRCGALANLNTCALSGSKPGGILELVFLPCCRVEACLDLLELEQAGLFPTLQSENSSVSFLNQKVDLAVNFSLTLFDF